MNRRRVPGCDAKSAADAGPSFTPCNLSPPLPWYITQQMGPFHRLSIVTVTDVITCCMLTQHEKKSGTFNSRGQICAKKPLSRLAPSNDGIPICTGPACILGSFSVQCIVRKREGKWDGQCGTRREENLGRVFKSIPYHSRTCTSHPNDKSSNHPTDVGRCRSVCGHLLPHGPHTHQHVPSALGLLCIPLLVPRDPSPHPAKSPQ